MMRKSSKPISISASLMIFFSTTLSITRKNILTVEIGYPDFDYIDVAWGGWLDIVFA
jgi:hypothetical protein